MFQAIMILGFLLAMAACAIGITIAFLGMIFDWNDKVVARSMAAMILGGVGMLPFGLGVLATSPSGPELQVGACYRAYQHDHSGYMPINTGKSVIIVPYTSQGIDLVEILCP